MRLPSRLRGVKWTNLIIAFDGGNDSGTKTSGDADAESPNHTANEDIPNHVLLSPSFAFRRESDNTRGVAKPSHSHLGAAKTTMTIEATIMTLPHTTNPTARNNF